MAAAVPLVAAVAGSAATSLAASAIGATLLGSSFLATLASSAVGFVVSSAISAIGGSIFSKKPKQPAFTNEAGGRTVMIRSSVESHKIIYGQARVSGPVVFAKTVNVGPRSDGTTADSVNKFLHMVIPLAGHEVEEIVTIYLNELPITIPFASGFTTTAPYYKEGYSYVRVFKHNGSSNQAADSALVNECGLTSAHRLRGIAYIYVRFEYNGDIFPLGIPNVSALVKGKKVYDPRTTLTAWSANWALCVRDYMTSDYGFDCLSDEINDDYFETAANISDESVNLVGGGTQARYACNGVIDTATAVLDNLSGLLSAGAGTVTYVQGKFRLYAGAYESPAGAITEDMLAAPLKHRLGTSSKDVFNAVKGTYVDPNKSYQPTDFPFITNATYEAEDGGDRIYKDLELPFTNHPEAAQRLAKQLLERSRQGIIVDLVVNHKALKFAVYDIVTFTNTALGWSSKEFRIIKWSIAAGQPISLTLQEEASASYDWNSGLATTLDPAPDTTLPSPFDVSPPGAVSVSEALYVTRDGAGVKARSDLSWVASSDAFLREYQVEFKLTAASTYSVAGRTTTTTFSIEDMAPGSYDFRVKAINNLGVSSAYSSRMYEVTALLAPPAEPQNMTISAIGGMAVIRWDLSADLDVRIGGKVIFRHSVNDSDDWPSTVSIGEAIPGSDTVAILPLKPGAYFAKMVDSSGTPSLDYAKVITPQATVIEFSNNATITESPDWGGTMENLTVSENDQLIMGSWIVNGFPWFGNRVELIDGSPTATYYFEDSFDFTTPIRIRLTVDIEAVVYAVSDLIDDRTDLIDSWDSIDGDTSVDADAIVYVRYTDDNPAGSPTWSAWNRLDSAEFFNRAFEFKLVLTTADPAFNIAVSSLSIRADEVV